MSEIVLFHHAQGLTPGVVAFADMLRDAGHAVHTPDLFGGRIFGSIETGMAHIEDVGFESLIDAGVRAGEAFPAEVVYAGFSFGVAPAQKLAQTRPGALGALLYYSCVPTSFFGTWPSDVPVQIHGMDADPLFVDDGDLDAARELVQDVDRAELFLYPGDQHYFADSSLSSYDPEASALLFERTLEFLSR